MIRKVLAGVAVAVCCAGCPPFPDISGWRKDVLGTLYGEPPLGLADVICKYDSPATPVSVSALVASVNLTCGDLPPECQLEVKGPDTNFGVLGTCEKKVVIYLRWNGLEAGCWRPISFWPDMIGVSAKREVDLATLEEAILYCDAPTAAS